MKTVLVLLMAATPVAAGAQQASPTAPTMNMPNYSSFNAGLDSARAPGADTPAMERHKLARAIALRDEATALQRADGGTLSSGHRRYLQRKADAIRAGR